MENYPSNSNASKIAKAKANQNEAPEKKVVNKVISGTVKTKQKSGFRKFADVFLPEDVDDIKSYILFDVMIPAAKKLISDTVDAFLYSYEGRKRSGTSAGQVSYINYNSRSTRGRNNIRDRRDPRSIDPMDTNVEFTTRGDAESVLMGMDELMSMYGMVTVADFKDLAGVTSTHTECNYGWMNITSAKVVPVRGGYIIKLPKASLID